ncbi:MAG: Ig-like domain-containing protein [Deltaproteobacteria bacterium]|nr:Ig-like domain-containing protein [Deltaproteobacteria bacterium]
MLLSRTLPVLAAALIGCGPSVTSISIVPTSVTLTEKGRTAVLKAEPKDKAGKPLVEAVLKLKWTCSNPAVAVVNNGVVTAVSSGESTCGANLGDVTGSAKILVSIPSKMHLVPDKAEIVGVGKQLILKPVVKDDTGRDVPGRPPVVWATSDSKVLNVSDSTITAEGPGAAEIKAALGALTAVAQISVTLPPVVGLAIDPPSIALTKEGEAIRLRAVATDERGEEIRGINAVWATADEKIATVSETGQVQAVKKGKTTIKATIGIKSAEAEIIVND